MRTQPSPPQKDGPSESDIAYTHAVVACNQIIRELDEQLKGSKYDARQPEKGPHGRRPDPAASG